MEQRIDGWTILADCADASWRLRLDHAECDRPLPPVLDAAAFAVLPIAMRGGHPLHLEGRLSRGALRNLREIAEAWTDWAPGHFTAVAVTADEVVDEARPAGDTAILAWGGDLRSSFAAIGEDAALSTAGLRIGRVVHVAGLGGPVPGAAALDRLRGAFAEFGVDLTTVTTDALEAGWIDPLIGPMPIVAAALHLAGDGFAFHARRGPMSAQRIRPRPAPTLADVWGGDRLCLVAVGGVTSAPRMTARFAAQPAFRALLAGCRATGFASPRCGRCGDCALLDLGLAGNGIGTAAGRACARFPLHDTWQEAEALLALRDWSGSFVRRTALAARLAAREVRRALDARVRWHEALAGKAEPWPR